ncbi:hypothetical protein VTI74DRAFT_793 [Chaetomium olivicolor]
MGRPPGTVGRSQLKPEDLVRIQTLSRDARMGPTQIQRITGYSIYQIKYALKKKTPTIGKRTGRPRKGESSPRKQGEKEGQGEGEGNEGQVGEGGEVQEQQVEQLPAEGQQSHSEEPVLRLVESSEPETRAGNTAEAQPGQ